MDNQVNCHSMRDVQSHVNMVPKVLLHRIFLNIDCFRLFFTRIHKVFGSPDNDMIWLSLLYGANGRYNTTCEQREESSQLRSPHEAFSSVHWLHSPSRYLDRVFLLLCVTQWGEFAFPQMRERMADAVMLSMNQEESFNSDGCAFEGASILREASSAVDDAEVACLGAHIVTTELVE